MSTGMQSPYAIANAAIAAKGFHTLPIKPGSKAPGQFKNGHWQGLQDWARYKSEPPTPLAQQIWSNWPDAGIGLICGSPAGDGWQVVCVDLDSTDPDILDTLQSALPQTPVTKCGAKGLSLFYRAPACLENFSVRGVVDVLAAGRQTVIPPSIHPDTGRAYQWIGTKTLADIVPADLPAFDEDAIERFRDTLASIGGAQAATKQQAEKRPVHAASGDGETFWRKLNNSALRNLDAWVPALNMPLTRKIAPQAYEALPHWRQSNTGRPDSERKASLKMHALGIKDMGASKGYTAIDLVQAATGKNLDEACSFLAGQLGMLEITPELVNVAVIDGVTVDVDTGEIIQRETLQEGLPLAAPLVEGAQHLAKSALWFDWKTNATSTEPVLNAHWLVKKLLPAEGLAVLFGRPGSGKSFAAFDIALHIAAGLPWRGLKAKPCGVSYIASEGGTMGVNRVHVWCEHNGESWPDKFRMSTVTLNLRSTEADARALISDIRTNQPDCGLVVVDTLNRNFAGGAENGDEDMGAFVQRCDLVAKHLNCCVLIVHHSGKDESKGARGHTSLLGAVSTELQISREMQMPGLIKVTKQRDGEDGQEFGFILKPIQLGFDDDGDPVTSCVIVECDIDPKAKQPAGKHQRAIRKTFINHLAECGQPTPIGPGYPEPGSYRCVELEAFIEFAAGRMTGARAARDIRRAVNGLVERSILGLNGGKLWLLE